MGAVTVQQRTLVLNAFASVLQNNLVTSSAVEWNEYEGEMDDRNKLKVIEQTSPRYNVTRTENGVKNLSAGTDGTVFGGEQFEVTGTFNANMGWGDFQQITDIGAARKSKALIGAATSMAEKIDAYILGVATTASADWVGDGSSSIDEWLDATRAYTRLKENGVTDNDLAFIMTHTDEQQLGDQVVKLPAPDGMATRAFRRGFEGEVSGIRTLFTNQLPNLATGTRSVDAGAINGAAQNTNYADVAGPGTVNGRSLTQDLAVDTLGANATIKAGEVFHIAGVFAFDNRKQALVSPARLQQFTVVQDVTANASGAATLRIFPAIIVPGSGTGDNPNINTAHATVNAAPADNALLTFKGSASANLSPRLLLQKESIVVNTVPLILPASDTSARRKLSKIPLTVRMWTHSDFNTGAHSVRFDVALNANIRDRRKMTRLNGS
jgi:hypothetical protein